MLISAKRIIKASIVNFWRNSFISLASILIMTVTLTILGLLILTGVLLNATLAGIQDKVDINVYFLTTAAEEDILGLKGEIEKLSEVKNVDYVSREQALVDFRERHKDDQLTLQALDELGENPLGAILNIKAKETSQYETIASFLEGDNALSREGSVIIDKVNYAQNKVVIDRLSGILDAAERLGFLTILIFAVISILITFNTIRLVIYTSREEIQVMRLVGASSPYIRGPFVLTGMLYGAVAALVTMILLYVAVLWFGPVAERAFGAISLNAYYFTNFLQLFVIIVGSGVILGGVSSYFSVRRYLTL